MLKIWGRVNSINVQKPLMVLEEVQIPYERIDAGLHFGINNTPEYKAMNPNGVVPTIDDDGFILWESNTVARYIARKFGDGKLWPTDVQEQANQDRWMDWQQTTMIAPVNAMFAPLIRGMGDKSPEAIEKGRCVPSKCWRCSTPGWPITNRSAARPSVWPIACLVQAFIAGLTCRSNGPTHAS